jgi:hypothetical protein
MAAFIAHKKGARTGTVASPTEIPTALFRLATAPLPYSCSSDQGRGAFPRRGQLHLPAAHLRAPPHLPLAPRASLRAWEASRFPDEHRRASPVIPAHLANESRPNSSRADAAPGNECKAAGSPSYEFPHGCIVLRASSCMVLLASSLRAPSVPTELR